MKYLLSLAQYFEQYLVVLNSDLIINQFIFKSRAQNCNMKLYCHEVNNSKQINLIKKESDFQYNALSHELFPCKILILESTYNEFVYCCKKGIRIYDFMLLHPEEDNLNITQ